MNADVRDAQLSPWLLRARVLIQARVADARSHGEAGRTADAALRMTELGAGLGGILGDARSTFYRQAFNETPFNAAIHDDVRPDGPGEMAARMSVIGGRNQYADVKRSIDAASTTLRALSDASRGETGDFWPTAFASWQSQATQTLTSRLHSTLSDAQMALCEAVNVVRIKPSLR
jgi:hypothetical protein